MPTAIETTYAGCRFRSRIEARWALFFDYLGIGWEYEPQGFNLPSGPYLPDFKLNLGPGVWWEVKGEQPTPDEMRSLYDLVIKTGKPAYIAWGSIPRDFTDRARISDPTGNRVRWFVTADSIGWAPADTNQPGIDNPRLFDAYSAARAARFETFAA